MSKITDLFYVVLAVVCSIDTLRDKYRINRKVDIHELFGNEIMVTIPYPHGMVIVMTEEQHACAVLDGEVIRFDENEFQDWLRNLSPVEMLYTARTLVYQHERFVKELQEVENAELQEAEAEKLIAILKDKFNEQY